MHHSQLTAQAQVPKKSETLLAPVLIQAETNDGPFGYPQNPLPLVWAAPSSEVS